MKAEYISRMGDDNMVVDAARVSFDKSSDHYSKEKNDRLIGYLARHGHWTPFSHPQITLRITVPIFVARQDFKHIVGFTRNEISRRYVDGAPEFFIPWEWRARPGDSIKQGSGGTHPNSGYWSHVYEDILLHAKNVYRYMIKDGVSPEQARMVLPQSMYTSYYTTGSLAAWARAYNLRMGESAQSEIRELYIQVGKIIEPLFPASWAALTSGELINE